MNGFSLYCRTSIFWRWLARFLSYCGSMKSNCLKFSIVTISPIVSNCRDKLCKSVVYFEKVKQIRPNTNEGKLQWKCNFQKIGSNEGDHSREMGADYVNRTHWGDCAVFIPRKSKPLVMMMMMAQWCQKCDGYERDHEIDNMIPTICLWFWCTFASPLLIFFRFRAHILIVTMIFLLLAIVFLGGRVGSETFTVGYLAGVISYHVYLTCKCQIGNITN